MEGLTLRTIGLATAALLSACGGRQSAEPLSPEAASLRTATHVDLTTALDTDGTANGRWAQLQVTTARSRAPFVGEVTTTNRRILLVDVDDDAGQIVANAHVCALDIETSTGMADTVVPAAMVDAMPVIVWTGQREEHTLTFDRSHEVLGLDVGPTDPLPEPFTDDPRLVDADADGHPGVTIQVTGMAGGEMYFGQRAWRELEVTEWDDARMDGVIHWDSERVLYDATSRALRNADPATPSEAAEENYFRSVRVRDDATCEEVVAAEALLFARE